MTSHQRDLVFISYAHRDQEPVNWLERLDVYLKQYQREGLQVWHDRKIPAGGQWRAEIEEALQRAGAAVLLVGPNFLGSDFIADHELPRLLDAARREGVHIFPLVTGYCSYADSDLGAFQAFNDPDEPLEALTPERQNQLLNRLAGALAEVFETRDRPETAPVPTPGPRIDAPGETMQPPARPAPPPARRRPGRVWRWLAGGLAVLVALAVWRFWPSPEAARLEALALAAPEVGGGEAVQGFVRLQEPARRALEVRLVVSEPGVVRVPESVSIPAGSREQAFPIETTPVDRAVAVDVGAMLGAQRVRAELMIRPVEQPEGPPHFIARMGYAGDELPRVDFDAQRGALPRDAVNDFLRPASVEMGEIEGAGPGFHLTLLVSNVGPEPMMLDLNDRFFSLEDERGRAAEMVFFCCPAEEGTLLPPGGRREVEMLFRSVPGWFSKERGVGVVFFRVQGLLPVRRAAWEIRLPQTAD